MLAGGPGSRSKTIIVGHSTFRCFERDIKLQTLGPGSFGKALEFERVEFGFEPLSYLGALKDVGWRARVEIENDHRGTFNVSLFCEEGMEFKISKVCGPDNRWQIVGHTIMNLGVVTIRPDRGGLYPFR